MDLQARNSDDKTLDEVLTDIKKSLVTNKNVELTPEQELTPEPFIIPSVISDPNKYIKQKDEKTKLDVNEIYEKQKIYDKMTEDKLDFLKDKHMNINPDITDINDLYLEGRTNKKGLLDEHALMGKLDCKSRTEYCFTNKELSKLCFTTGNNIHDTYILPCKLRTELKKLINFICNQNIEEYKDSYYLQKGVKLHIEKVLPKFGFSADEISILFYSGRDSKNKTNIFTMLRPVKQRTIRVLSGSTDSGRGIYFKLLLNKFSNEDKLLNNIINKYITGLIVNYNYTELDAIDSAFKFLNTILLGSDTYNEIEQYYINLYEENKRRMRKILDSDSE